MSEGVKKCLQETVAYAYQHWKGRGREGVFKGLTKSKINGLNSKRNQENLGGLT